MWDYNISGFPYQHLTKLRFLSYVMATSAAASLSGTPNSKPAKHMGFKRAADLCGQRLQAKILRLPPGPLNSKIGALIITHGVVRCIVLLLLLLLLPRTRTRTAVPNV